MALGSAGKQNDCGVDIGHGLLIYLPVGRAGLSGGSGYSRLSIDRHGEIVFVADIAPRISHGEVVQCVCTESIAVTHDVVDIFLSTFHRVLCGEDIVYLGNEGVVVVPAVIGTPSVIGVIRLHIIGIVIPEPSVSL